MFKSLPKQFQVTAKTMAGMEGVLANELNDFEVTDVVEERRAVTFRCDKETLYSLNYNLRTALKLIVPIASFRVYNDHHLYKNSYEIPWETYFGVDQSFAIQSVVHSPVFKHTGYPALKVKDAIVDRFRKKFDQRPDVDLEMPDMLVNLRISENECVISLDSSGDSLHKRGYRKHSYKAPMSEVLAAGILHLSTWDKKSDVENPMCGSGTIGIEAMMMASNIPAQYFRPSFGFQNWNNYDEELWEQVKKKSEAKMKPASCKFHFSDVSLKAVSITKRHIEALPVQAEWEATKENFLNSEAKGDGFIFMNPPYDERLTLEDAHDFYDKIGTRLKHHFIGNKIFIISGALASIKRIGLKPTKKWTLYNGPIECRLHAYEVYEGSKKHK